MRQTRDSRLARLAKNLDAIPAKDQLRIRKEQEIETLRQRGAMELYRLIEEFVKSLNTRVSQVSIEFTPEHYDARDVHNPAQNLFQINTAGRVVQVNFAAHEESVSTERFRTPYILDGVIRWYNQDLLDREEIREELLFLCFEKGVTTWVVYDLRRHRSCTFDDDHLVDIMEQLI